MSGAIRSVSHTASTPCSRHSIRSSPRPVSIDGFGNSVRLPSGAWLYCMKTRFQNSMNRSPCGIAERAAVGTERRAAVDVDLAARTARAGVAHLPEVVLVAEALDALHRHADLLVPDRLGLVVAVVDGDPQLVAVDARTSRWSAPSSTG